MDSESELTRKKFEVLGATTNMGLISYVSIKLCKSNINIHRVDIHTNQMRLDLFCSNVGEWYCINYLDSKMANENGKTPNFRVLVGPNPIKVGVNPK